MLVHLRKNEVSSPWFSLILTASILVLFIGGMQMLLGILVSWEISRETIATSIICVGLILAVALVTLGCRLLQMYRKSQARKRCTCPVDERMVIRMRRAEYRLWQYPTCEKVYPSRTTPQWTHAKTK
jgi:hypothetical protein